MRRLATAVAFAGLACGGEPRPQVEVGAPAPRYAATTLAGDSATTASLTGKVVLLNVWATWCAPCRDEIPYLQSLYEKHRQGGLEIIGVSVDARGQDAAIREFAQDFGMTYPIWRDPDERVSTQFLVVGVPATFLIDREGILRWKKTGPIEPGDPTLTAAIERALAGD